MNIYNKPYKGFNAYHLENESLKLIVLPGLGRAVYILMQVME